VSGVTLPATGTGTATPVVATYATANGHVQRVADGYSEMEALADQAGAGDVLTFIFSADVDLAMVRSVGGVSRAHPSGTPTATSGAYCANDEPEPLPVRTSEINVWAPASATVSVWGYRL
jgi:hypothetical protein